MSDPPRLPFGAASDPAGGACRRDGDRVTGSVSVTVRWWRIAIAALSLGLLALLLVYAFVENFAPVG